MIAKMAGELPKPAARWATISPAVAAMAVVSVGTFAQTAKPESADISPAAVTMAVASEGTFVQTAWPEQWLGIAMARVFILTAA